MAYYVYIIASQRNGTLYVGVTNDLVRRVYEHRNGVAEGFSKRHGVKVLVYFEMHESIEAAIEREKRLKRWQRKWKLELIERENPTWRDLWAESANEVPPLPCSVACPGSRIAFAYAHLSGMTALTLAPLLPHTLTVIPARRTRVSANRDPGWPAARSPPDRPRSNAGSGA
jgi:putative endonuclease